MPKSVFHSFLFLLILAVFLVGLTSWFQSQITPADPYVLKEPTDSLDVIFLGDSELVYSFIPTQLWQEQGITSYNCGYPKQYLYRAEDVMEAVFQNQSPKAVILETNMLYYEENRTDALYSDLAMIFPLLRNHDGWKPDSMLGWPALSVPAEGTENVAPAADDSWMNYCKGYYFSQTIKPATLYDYMAPSDACAIVPAKNVQRLRRIAETCRNHGAELILVSSPSPSNWNTRRHNGIIKTVTVLGIPYIDTNVLPDDVPIDWQTDTMDTGDHLNYFGAVKFSRYLGNYLAETGLFTDRRNDPAYADWNTNALAFYDSIAPMISIS